jgi:cytochrome c553
MLSISLTSLTREVFESAATNDIAVILSAGDYQDGQNGATASPSHGALASDTTCGLCHRRHT